MLTLWSGLDLWSFDVHFEASLHWYSISCASEGGQRVSHNRPM